MSKLKLVTKTDAESDRQLNADIKYRAKLTEAIKELANANTAFDVFCNTDVDFSTITGTKVGPSSGRHPQDAAWEIVREALRDKLMAALNNVVYLDQDEASDRMSSMVWADEDRAKYPDRYKW